MPIAKDFDLPDYFGPAEYLALLEQGEAGPRDMFLRSFRRRLPPLARLLAMAHKEIHKLTPYTQDHERTATIHMFLHVALNSLYSSTALLVDCYPIVSCHLMRQYGESVAMTLLLLDDDPNVWHQYQKLGNKYPVHDSLGRPLKKATARRLRKLIGFDAAAWSGFVALTKFYDQFSHPSELSLAFHMMLRRPGIVVIGPAFDPGKRRELSIELKRRRSALRQLLHLLRAVRRVMKGRPLGWAA